MFSDSPWHINSFFRKLDRFGQPIPAFNMKGKDKVNTIAGGFFSIILFMTLFMYSSFKFTYLVTKHNPNISTYIKEDEMFGTVLNLNERNFRFAFTVEPYYNPTKQKNDPRYVKYFIILYGKHKGENFQRVLPYHKCTDDDYDEFYQVKK